MKTTVEIPEELYQRVRVMLAEQNRSRFPALPTRNHLAGSSAPPGQ